MISVRKRVASSDIITNRKKKTKKSIYIQKTLEYYEGQILVSGNGLCGQLGLGPDTFEIQTFSLVDFQDVIVDICAGGMHSVILSEKGEVWTFGCNDDGTLGRPTNGEEDEAKPGKVALPAKAKQITAGDCHTAVLLENGKVFAWGTFRDSNGSMGLHPTITQLHPIEMSTGFKPIIKICSGANHLVFLNNGGEILTLGCSEQGQLGRRSLRNVQYGRNCAPHKLDRASDLIPQMIKLKSSQYYFEDIWTSACGTYAKVYGKNDIYVFGLNNYKQLGLDKNDIEHYPTLSEEFSQYNLKLISGSIHHTIALDADNKVYVIGRKDYGCLGLGEYCPELDKLTEIVSLRDKKIKQISAGPSVSFAISSKGELFAWGMGTNGQLGTGNEDDLFVPTLIKSRDLEERLVTKVSVGGQHTMILGIIEKKNRQIQH